MSGRDDTTAGEARAARLAAALRDNLRRRKAQARGDIPAAEGPDPAGITPSGRVP